MELGDGGSDVASKDDMATPTPLDPLKGLPQFFRQRGFSSDFGSEDGDITGSRRNSTSELGSGVTTATTPTSGMPNVAASTATTVQPLTSSSSRNTTEESSLPAQILGGASVDDVEVPKQHRDEEGVFEQTPVMEVSQRQRPSNSSPFPSETVQKEALSGKGSSTDASSLSQDVMLPPASGARARQLPHPPPLHPPKVSSSGRGGVSGRGHGSKVPPPPLRLMSPTEPVNPVLPGQPPPTLSPLNLSPSLRGGVAMGRGLCGPLPILSPLNTPPIRPVLPPPLLLVEDGSAASTTPHSPNNAHHPLGAGATSRPTSLHGFTSPPGPSHTQTTPTAAVRVGGSGGGGLPVTVTTPPPPLLGSPAPPTSLSVVRSKPGVIEGAGEETSIFAPSSPPPRKIALKSFSVNMRRSASVSSASSKSRTPTPGRVDAEEEEDEEEGAGREGASPSQPLASSTRRLSLSSPPPLEKVQDVDDDISLSLSPSPVPDTPPQASPQLPVLGETSSALGVERREEEEEEEEEAGLSREGEGLVGEGEELATKLQDRKESYSSLSSSSSASTPSPPPRATPPVEPLQPRPFDLRPVRGGKTLSVSPAPEVRRRGHERSVESDALGSEGEERGAGHSPVSSVEDEKEEVYFEQELIPKHMTPPPAVTGHTPSGGFVGGGGSPMMADQVITEEVATLDSGVGGVVVGGVAEGSGTLIGEIMQDDNDIVQTIVSRGSPVSDDDDIIQQSSLGGHTHHGGSGSHPEVSQEVLDVLDQTFSSDESDESDAESAESVSIKGGVVRGVTSSPVREQGSRFTSATTSSKMRRGGGPAHREASVKGVAGREHKGAMHIEKVREIIIRKWSGLLFVGNNYPTHACAAGVK